MESSNEIVDLHARELILRLGKTIGAVEMMKDAASDGDDVEIECCKRVFDMKNHGWEEDVKKTTDWDRKIVFGEGKRVETVVQQARL